MRWVRYARAWLLGPARREHIERHTDMAGDLTFPHATITIHVANVNLYGNPAEVTQRLDQIVSAVQSLQSQGVQEMATAQEIKDAVQELTDKVAAQAGDVASMRTFIAGLETTLQAQLDLAGASDEIKQAVTDVMQGVTANTDQIKAAIDSDPST